LKTISKLKSQPLTYKLNSDQRRVYGSQIETHFYSMNVHGVKTHRRVYWFLFNNDKQLNLGENTRKIIVSNMTAVVEVLAAAAVAA